MWRMFLILGLSLLSAGAQGEEPPRAATAPMLPSAAEIEAWIADLNSPDFARREVATRHLLQSGPVVADDLVAAAQRGPLESTVRVNAILRTWFTSGREDLVEAGESSLELLSQSKNRHAASRAVAVLDQHALTIRQPRALAKIEKLGGQIERLDRGRTRGFVPDDSEPFFIVLGRDWRGGEDGLKYVRRIASLNVLYLLRDRATGKVATPGISNEAVDELQRTMPQLRIQYRGRAFLGISGNGFANGCRVESLREDSPADKAKFLPGDVISKFDGKPVRNFEELVDLIAEKQPGDTIKVEILRGDEDDLLTLERLQSLKGPGPAQELAEQLRKKLAKELSVTLGEWRGK